VRGYRGGLLCLPEQLCGLALKSFSPPVLWIMNAAQKSTNRAPLSECS